MSNAKNQVLICFKRLPRFARNDSQSIPFQKNEKGPGPFFWMQFQIIGNWGLSPIFLFYFRNDDADEVFLLEHGVEHGEFFGQDLLIQGFLLG